MVNCSSYAETLHSLVEYHKDLLSEVRNKFKFPVASVAPFIALRKNVEIGFLCSPLIEWEREAVSRYGKRSIQEEYYPLVFDFVKATIIPRKCRDYSCDMTYFHIFSPVYHGNMICSFFVNVFEKPIFKKFNAQHSSLEQEIVAQISAFFRKQNKYGPEQICVSILDNKFITIFISGLLSPFLKDFVKDNAKDAAVIEKIFTMQIKILLVKIFKESFNSKMNDPFIFFDKEKDKLIVLSSMSGFGWKSLLEAIHF